MAEYIEREAALAAIAEDECETCKRDHRILIGVVFSRARAAVAGVPAADVVEVRHGEWVLAAYDTAVPYALGKWNIWICSECGYRRKAGWEHTEDGRKPRAKYCENCMAKMDGGVNDAAD